MGILASLLPGLRDLRTPLSVGYLWLTAAWLLFADHIPTQDPHDGSPYSAASRLVEFLGLSIALAALSFSAYVIGCVLCLPEKTILKLGSRFDRGSFVFNRSIHEARSELRERVEASEVQRRAEANVIREIIPAELTRRIMQALSRGIDTQDLRTRLLISDKKEVYGEYDRMASEAAFRLNISAPLAFIIAVLAVNGEPYVFLGLVIPLTLTIQGLSRAAEAMNVLYRAVQEKIITHPLVELLDELNATPLGVMPGGPVP